MTSIIFNCISQGSISDLTQELQKMGIQKPDVIGNLIDEENFS